MKVFDHLLTLLALVFTTVVVTSCHCRDDDEIIVNSIGGFYFFVNETTNDSIDNYDATQGKRLEAHNGDSLSLIFKSSLPEGAPALRCRMTFVLPDGLQHVVEDSTNHDMAYGYVVRNAPLGERMLQIIPKVIDERVTYTGRDSIVIFRMDIVK